MNQVALEASNLRMVFNNINVLNKVSIKIYSGEAMALVGENGAGKSTLIKCISGVYKPLEGTIKIFNKQLVFTNTKQAIKAGIGVVHQELKLCENMSIVENIFLGRWQTKGQIISYKKMQRAAKKYLNMLGLSLDSRTKVKALSIAQQQMVEIARVLSLGAKIIILDEPTDTLSNQEASSLFKVLKRLKQSGIGILYVTHRMQEIKQICERFTVLKDGKFVSTGNVSNVSIDTIIESMIGRKLQNQFPQQSQQKRNLLIVIKNLTSSLIFDINLKIYNGEILGIAGLVGSKRTEFAKTIVGLMPKTFGSIKIKEKILTRMNVKKAIKNGIYYVTENRKKNGLFLNLKVSHNIVISNLKCVTNRIRLISNMKIKKYVHELQQKLNIKFNNSNLKTINLSGGNQQKVLLAKALFTSPNLLILDEPTRGVDVGARKEIYKIISDFVKQGKAVIIISSDLLEIIGISQRVAVFNKGRLNGILMKKMLSEKAIMNLAVKA